MILIGTSQVGSYSKRGKPSISLPFFGGHGFETGRIYYLPLSLRNLLRFAYRWTHTIFIVLHALVFLMKQHSYNAYNGYLSVVFKRKTMLERKLAHLDTMKPNGTLQGHTTGLKPAANDPAVRHRRLRSLPRQESYVSTPMKTDLADDTAELASIASAIESDESLDPGQFILFNRIIRRELSLLEVELRGKCSLTENHYPHNLNLKDFVEWTFFPTLVYELEYPREEKINWAYVAEKTGAVFGVLAVMQIISQAYIYPVVASTIGSSALPPSQRLSLFLWASLDLLFPLLLEQLLTWYLIWECVLNVLAELTGFADRGFYGRRPPFSPSSSKHSNNLQAHGGTPSTSASMPATGTVLSTTSCCVMSTTPALLHTS